MAKKKKKRKKIREQFINVVSHVFIIMKKSAVWDGIISSKPDIVVTSLKNIRINKKTFEFRCRILRLKPVIEFNQKKTRIFIPVKICFKISFCYLNFFFDYSNHINCQQQQLCRYSDHKDDDNYDHHFYDIHQS